MSQDVLLTMMNSMSLNDESVNVEMQRSESCDKLHDKDTAICKLKEIIKSLREKSKEENVNSDKCEIVTINVELENMNLKSAENEDLKAQIQDKVFVITSLKNDLRKLKGKQIVDNAAQIPSATTIVPGMFKLDLDPLALKVLQNRDAHIDNLKHTQEQADIHRGIVEQAKAKHPLDNVLDFVCKHAKRIQELLIYVRDTYPNVIKLSAKKVVVTPKNNVKKVRFGDPLTSSSNIKQVASSKTSDSNTLVLSSTRLKCSTSNCGLKPAGNKKNDRISQTPSRNMENKVEAQPRKVNKKNCVVEPIHDANVKHSLLNANSKLFVRIVKFPDGPLLAKDGLARGIPRLKFQKDHLCSACALGKSMKSSHQPKAKDTNQEKLYLLHMDLCGPMCVASINGKSSRLASNPVSQQPCIPLIRDDWDRLFQPMFDEYFNPPTNVVSLVQEATAPRTVVLADSPVSTSIDQDAPSASIPSTQEQEHSLIISQGFEESPKTPLFHDDPLHESLHEDQLLRIHLMCRINPHSS
ncbi:hypothetical protein Tco_0858251 [Tanacetum coccineum]|uniref:Uncharacterized protein n=1 Tax=Tanacetum coccineum TaxID=301880 RepID=A0ABQ5BAF3_9ASTR